MTHLHISPSDLVLEVGSGNNPSARSNILVDRYLYDNGQRAGGFRIVVDRPLIVADGYRLPFKDKSFDYVICSHILEHMKDPKKFIEEIVRVGKAGYIEVPSDMSERIFGWNFHLWYCSFNGKTLVLRKKTEGERFGGFFHRLIAQHIWFRRFFEEYEDSWYIKYEWKNHIKLFIDFHTPTKEYLNKLDENAWKLLQPPRSNIIADGIFYIQWIERRIVKKTNKIMRKIFWLIKKKQVISLLACPICKGKNFVESKDVVVCNNCQTQFPMIGDIPIMLSPAERKKGY